MQTSNPRCGQAPTLSVVFSFWNEEEVLPELLLRLRRVLVPLVQAQALAGYELVFVNDASTDRSEALLLDAVAEGDVRLVNMSRNFGVAPCTLAGLSLARGDLVVYMDADLQDPPELIPELLDAWRADPQVEVVHTVRTDRRGEGGLRKALTWLGYRVLRSSASVDLPIEAGDYKLLTRRVVAVLNRLEEPRPFVRGLVRWVGHQQAVVPYIRQPRGGGASKFPVLGSRVVLNFLESALASSSYLPLRALLAGGGLLVVLSGLAGLGLFLSGWVGRPLSGWAVVLVAVGGFSGIQLAGLGILGLYLGRIHEAAMRRPLYLVQEVHEPTGPAWSLPQAGARGMPPGESVA